MAEGANSEDINKLYFLGLSHIISKSVALAVEMRLDQHLSEQLTSIDTLAEQFDYHPRALLRLLRVLDVYELVELKEEDQVKQGKLLPYLNRIISPHMLDSYQFIDRLSSSMKTNRECYSDVFGKPFYPHLLDHPEKLDAFKIWCTQSAIDWLPPLFSIYDFSRFKKVIDVGGGEGYFLAEMLAKHSEQQGVLFDQPEVIKQANTIFKKYNVANRATAIGGDFFKSVPEGADLYCICRTLLNWDDNDALKIINNCQKVMSPNSTLLIIDFFIPERDHPQYHQGVINDINLLACVNSAVRTKKEWIDLARQSNLTYRQVYTTIDNKEAKLHVPMLILELVP